ncbi:MAG: glutamate synthase subunit alpha, partial [Burkholderiales bacterium]
PDETIHVRLAGSAGQSFGAFLARGITLDLTGDANDYVGKGLSGGRIIVRQPTHVKRDPAVNIIVGNTVLYGAIAGEAYFNGVAGERFAVRNSGALAVVEGAGDHACEYMTGGVAVILGETGRNFGAGMTNGVAFVYDSAGKFEHRYNPELVRIERIIEPDDSQLLRQLIFRHMEKTDSDRAREILDRWSEIILHFWKVEPRSKPKSPPPRTRQISSAETAKV